MAKKRINISISPDTEKRLKQYALENHTTVSQAITNWIWSTNIELEGEVKRDNKEKFDFELGFGLGDIF